MSAESKRPKDQAHHDRVARQRGLRERARKGFDATVLTEVAVPSGRRHRPVPSNDLLRAMVVYNDVRPR